MEYCKGLQPKLPDDNRDLWEFFWDSLQGCATAEFVWTKAHRSFEGLSGLDLAIAKGNDAADAQAKACVKRYQVSSELYRTVVQAKLCQLKMRLLLDSFHVHLALAAVGQDNGEFQEPCSIVDLCLVGPSWKAPEVAPPSAGFHAPFVSQVFNWFRDLHWFSGCSAGGSCDISWVELFCFGSLTVAVCHLSRLTVSGCVWVSMRMPYVVFRRRTRFFVPGVGLCLLSFALVIWFLVLLLLHAARLLSWGLALRCLGSRGDLGCLWWLGVTFPFSSLLFARYLRCVFPPCGRRFWWTHGPQPR